MLMQRAHYTIQRILMHEKVSSSLLRTLTLRSTVFMVRSAKMGWFKAFLKDCEYHTHSPVLLPVPWGRTRYIASAIYLVVESSKQCQEE